MGLDLVGATEISVISQVGDLLIAGISLARGDKAIAMMSMEDCRLESDESSKECGKVDK